LVGVLLFTLAALARSGDWKIVVADDQLVVQSRPWSGSALNEIKGVTYVDASLNALMALLKDAPANQDWVYRSGGARMLQEEGYAQATVYGVVDAPWPMQDRDSVVRFAYRQHSVSKDIAITITNFPDYLPPQKGFVRVPQLGGFWRLQPQTDGRVKVTYQVYGDPGGAIPVWLANHAAVLSVKYTLLNLPAAVSGYRDARSEFVREVGE
jgi:hypothetical protein